MMRFAKAQMAISGTGERRATDNWLYHSQELKGYITIPDADTVCTGCECPRCGEDRVDWLEWSDDGEHVECASCGAWYDPNEEVT